MTTVAPCFNCSQSISYACTRHLHPNSTHLARATSTSRGGSTATEAAAPPPPALVAAASPAPAASCTPSAAAAAAAAAAAGVAWLPGEEPSAASDCPAAWLTPRLLLLLLLPPCCWQASTRSCAGCTTHPENEEKQRDHERVWERVLEGYRRGDTYGTAMPEGMGCLEGPQLKGGAKGT